MSEVVLREIIDRAVADDSFRRQLLSDPSTALRGYELSDAERELLSNLDEGNFDEFAGGLGDRATKGWITPSG
jgi:hypothetical protein